MKHWIYEEIRYTKLFKAKNQHVNRNAAFD